MCQIPEYVSEGPSGNFRFSKMLSELEKNFREKSLAFYGNLKGRKSKFWKNLFYADSSGQFIHLK